MLDPDLTVHTNAGGGSRLLNERDIFAGYGAKPLSTTDSLSMVQFLRMRKESNGAKILTTLHRLSNLLPMLAACLPRAFTLLLFRGGRFGITGLGNRVVPSQVLRYNTGSAIRG